ncbi:Plastidic glucose transporter 4 [Bienertia sinuspersici]
MKASTFMVKGNLGFEPLNRRVSGIGSVKNSSSVLCSNPRLVNNNHSNYKVNPCKLSFGSISMGAGFARLGFDQVLKSSAKYRSVKTQATSGGDPEDAAPVKHEGKSSASVLPYVGVACLGAILFGYHLGSITGETITLLDTVVNGALDYLSADLAIAGNPVLQGWVVSILLAGATVGSFTGGSLADQFGRTRTFQLDAIPLAVGAYLCATAQTVQIMMIGRLLCGIGIGISSALVPLYISEISPTDIRGALGSVENNVWYSYNSLSSLGYWMGFCPESPRWLFQQGKIAEAQKAVAALYGKDRVSEVINDLRTSVQVLLNQKLAGLIYSAVATGKMAGINAVVYYSTSVFRSAGIASDVAARTAVASSLMDKQGRKSLLMTSFSGMAASMLLLSLSFTWKVLAPYSGTLAVLGTVLYVLSFSLGAGPASNFIIGLYFLSVVNKFGISTVYLGFASVCLLAALYIAGNVVETKGRSLEEIELALNPAL